MSARCSPNPIQNLANAIYNAALRDSVVEVSNTLSGLSPDLMKELLHSQRLYRTDESNPTTLLLAAAANGSKQVVEFLLDFHSKHCENKVLKCMENCTSALSEAGTNGHMHVIKILLRREVNVNEMNAKRKTALHKVCCTSRIRIVKYLLSQGARTDIGDLKGETCLFKACRHGHEKVVRLLLQKGADPNHTSISKSTPLHAAAAKGNLAIVQMLLEKGATISKDENGLSPLTAAAIPSSVECVEYFLTMPAFSRQEKIDAMELLGGALVRHFPQAGYNYLKRAMEERYRDPDDILLKPHRPPIPELDNVVESHTLEELESKNHNLAVLRMEGLLTRERILGTDHTDIGQRYLFLITGHHDFHRLDDFLKVWKYVRKPFRWPELQFQFSSMISGLLSRMVEVGSPPLFEVFLHVLEVESMVKEREASASAKENFVGIANRSLWHLIRIIWTALQVVRTNDELLQLQGAASQLMKVFSPFPEIHVLHCAVVHAQKHLEHHWTEEGNAIFISFIDILVKCGADVDQKDEDGDTPLHILAGQSFMKDDLPKFACSETRVLVEAGAHTDARNKNNQTPVDVAATDAVRAILLESRPLPLKCLAASTIVKCSVAFQGRVPSFVENFIKLHSPHHQ